MAATMKGLLVALGGLRSSGDVRCPLLGMRLEKLRETEGSQEAPEPPLSSAGLREPAKRRQNAQSPALQFRRLCEKYPTRWRYCGPDPARSEERTSRSFLSWRIPGPGQ